MQWIKDQKDPKKPQGEKDDKQGMSGCCCDDPNCECKCATEEKEEKKYADSKSGAKRPSGASGDL